MLQRSFTLLLLASSILLSACDDSLWNNPYPAADHNKPIFYSLFDERPKHLDPAQAYSENEYTFLAQIYAPPFQYHYLKRPYQLVPLAAQSMPRVTYLDKQRQVLPANAAADSVAFSVYEIQIKPNMAYQPHPVFAKDGTGKPLYWNLNEGKLAGINGLDDFKQTGTRMVTAADYVHQIKRLAHPQLHTPILGIMSQYIVGMEEFAKAAATLNEQNPKAFLDLSKLDLAGVKVIDNTSYSIEIKGKYPQFAYWLAMPFFAPMPPEIERFYAQAGMKERNISLDWWPIGSGPYYLSENDPNRRMVLTRNPYYNSEVYPSEGDTGDAEAGLLKDAGKPLPLIEQVVFSVEKETIPAWNKFLQGYYDASGISSDSFDQAVQVGVSGEATVTDSMKKQGITLTTSVATSTMYTGFNWLDNTVGGNSESARKLRQAIAIAMDFEEFVSIFANGRGISAQSPIPPGIFGFREGQAGMNPYVYDWVNGAPKRKSVEFAKKLLAEAGYPNGISKATGQPLVINLDTTDNGLGNKARLDWVRKQFAKINIQLVVRSTDYNRFQEKVRKGDVQMFYFGWNADYPDPENFLFLLHGPQGKAKFGGENAANYSNPEYDALFEQMKNMENGPERQKIIDQMLAILQHDSPWLWGFHPKDYVLRHSWLSNAKPNVMANNKLKYWSINVNEREQRRNEWNQPVYWPLFVLFGSIAALIWFIRGVIHKRATVLAKHHHN